jgi:type IV pilus assembly protein PilA
VIANLFNLGKLYPEAGKNIHPKPEGEATMKTEFQTKFIQHLSNRKGKDEGFTLIELLVVIIIIGILAAIALPSFLNQAAKARQSEAKNSVGAVMRQQQAHRLENGAFAGSMNRLKVGLPTETDNYTYEFDPAGGDDEDLASDVTAVTINATPLDPETLLYYTGTVAVEGGQTRAQACQGSEIGEEPVSDPTAGELPADRCTTGEPMK